MLRSGCVQIPVSTMATSASTRSSTPLMSASDELSGRRPARRRSAWSGRRARSPRRARRRRRSDRRGAPARCALSSLAVKPRNARLKVRSAFRPSRWRWRVTTARRCRRVLLEHHDVAAGRRSGRPFGVDGGARGRCSARASSRAVAAGSVGSGPARSDGAGGSAVGCGLGRVGLGSDRRRAWARGVGSGGADGSADGTTGSVEAVLGSAAATGPTRGQREQGGEGEGGGTAHRLSGRGASEEPTSPRRALGSTRHLRPYGKPPQHPVVPVTIGDGS